MTRLLMFSMAALLVGCSGGYVYQNAEPLEMSKLDYSFPSSETTVRGIRISFIDQGTGPRTLLLVHGLASNGGFWRYNIAELAKHFRVIAVDLPGYGRSEKKPFPYTMTFYADILSELLKTLHVDKVTYVGHSMGGQIGIHFALRHAAQLDRLVLTSPAGFEPFTRGDGDWLKSVMTVDFVKKTTEDRIRANLAGNFYSYSDKYEWMVEERARMTRSSDFEAFCYAVVRSVHGMLNEPTTALLPCVSVPTLIVFGEEDGLIPNPILHGGRSADVAAIGASAIPNNTVKFIPRAGHMVQMEQSEMYNETVLSWLAQATRE